MCVFILTDIWALPFHLLPTALVWTHLLYTEREGREKIIIYNIWISDNTTRFSCLKDDLSPTSNPHSQLLTRRRKWSVWLWRRLRWWAMHTNLLFLMTSQHSPEKQPHTLSRFTFTYLLKQWLAGGTPCLSHWASLKQLYTDDFMCNSAFMSS